MRYHEECTTSQMLETFYFCVQKVDVESIEFINFIFNPFKRLCCEKEKHFKKIMKKKFFKAALAIAAIATVGLGSYKAYDSYTAANMSENDLLLTEDVLALSDPNYGNNSQYTYEGGFKDSQMTISKCVNCGMDIGAGKCSLIYNFHFSCSYTDTRQVAAHMYDCWSGSRLTEPECKALMQKWGTHPKANCTGH